AFLRAAAGTARRLPAARRNAGGSVRRCRVRDRGRFARGPRYGAARGREDRGARRRGRTGPPSTAAAPSRVWLLLRVSSPLVLLRAAPRHAGRGRRAGAAEGRRDVAPRAARKSTGWRS